MSNATVVAIAAAACVLAGALAGCSDDAPTGAGTKTAEVLGASTFPKGSTTVPAGGGEPGFDCGAAVRARSALDGAVDAALDRLGLTHNSPESFDVTVIVTAQYSDEYWRLALVSVPDDLVSRAHRITSHWNKVGPSIAAVARPYVETPSKPPPANAAQRRQRSLDLRIARNKVDSLNSDASHDVVAVDEQAMRRRLERSCPEAG